MSGLVTLCALLQKKNKKKESLMPTEASLQIYFQEADEMLGQM
jgi:hypothetical protein